MVGYCEYKFSGQKNAKRKSTMQLFINNNVKFCYQSKNYPQTHLEECKYEQKKIKIENLIDDDLENVCLIMIIMMKWNLMTNLTNNLLTAKKVF